MALSNRQTFFFDGQTYNYRITEAGIRRFEQDGKRRIHYGMSLTMVVRALYHVSQSSLPFSIGLTLSSTLGLALSLCLVIVLSCCWLPPSSSQLPLQEAFAEESV